MAALLVTPNVRIASRNAGVGVSTLRRWLTQPAFSEEYRRLSRETRQQAVSAVLAAQREAVHVLIHQMRTGPADGRVRAASKLLELGNRIADDDLDQRVSRLEQITEESDEVGPGYSHRSRPN